MRLYISRDGGKMLEMLKLQSGPVPKQEVASWPWWHFLKVCFGISVLYSGKKFYKEARQYKLCCILNCIRGDDIFHVQFKSVCDHPQRSLPKS